MGQNSIDLQEELIESVKSFIENRDEASFEKLYKLSYKKLFAYVQAMAKDREKTGDVLQNSYIICYKKIDQLNDPYKFISWMKNICYHELAHSYDDRVDLLSDTQSADEDVDFFDNIQDEKMEMPEKAAEDANLKRLLLKNISTLPEKQRMALIAFYFEDRSIKDIAEAMGIPENTVKTYLNRARKSMNEQMKSYADANGLKMVPFAVVPFLAMLFSEDVHACGLLAGSESIMWNSLKPALAKSGMKVASTAAASSTTSAVGTATGAASSSATATTAGASAMGIGVKLAIGGLVATLVGGGVGVVATRKYIENTREEEVAVVSENEEAATDLETIEPTEEIATEPEVKEIAEEDSSLSDTKKVWEDMELTEYYDSVLGIHFYLPSELQVELVPTGKCLNGMAVRVTGMGIDGEYIFFTSYSPKKIDEYDGNAEGSYEYKEIYEDNYHRHYNLGFVTVEASAEFGLDFSEAAQQFISDYSDKIVETASVDSDVLPLHYTFGWAGPECDNPVVDYSVKNINSNWVEHGEEGSLWLVAGIDFPPGIYHIQDIYGTGSVVIFYESSENKSFRGEVKKYTGVETHVDTTIEIKNNEVLWLAPVYTDCLGVTLDYVPSE
ncbi:RNA polymerase sigma factor [Butyrivibrio sp. AC2005]|uniref:RNA polymerase sigma factor n=1 Tax=Butyrivibrio sp. AC2005 TaxID=1280672 RepID=UPI00040CAA19|nr:sigma-70 family RNA polymerase sigma factor [Butyrivibrio sp. AC2005]